MLDRLGRQVASFALELFSDQEMVLPCSAVFPPGTPGLALDTLARHALWAAGLDYRHGTGHGVGAALNVHEGPISISKRLISSSCIRAACASIL